ncbi:MAG: hypothetical protein AABY76_00160, partial [Planctomycetota bacterium]
MSQHKSTNGETRLDMTSCHWLIGKSYGNYRLHVTTQVFRLKVKAFSFREFCVITHDLAFSLQPSDFSLS